MARWRTTITILDLKAKRVRVKAVRTDGDDVQTYTAEATVDPNDKAGSKQKIVAALWDAYQASKAKADASASMLGDWAQALDAALEKREPE